MKKKKKRMYDGGQSVLHVKNSAGGFYKVKKTGRLGKNCIYFSGSGRCTKYAVVEQVYFMMKVWREKG